LLLESRRESSIFDEVASLTKNPKLTQFDRLRLEAHLAWKTGKLDEAIEKFRQADQLRPNDPPLVLALAQALMAKGESLLAARQDSAAEPWFQQALRLSNDLIQRTPTFGPIYDVVYGHYMRRNQLAEADRIRKLKVDHNPGVADFRLQLAAHYLQTQRPEEARRVIDALIADRKTFPDGRDRAGDFYFSQQQYDKAIEYYQGGLNEGGERRLHFQRKIADVLVAQGRIEKAVALLEQQILKENPRDPVALALRARLLLESRSPSYLKQAVNELQESVRELPNNPVVRYNLGRALFLGGEVEPARIQFETAAKLRADYVPPLIALSEIHIRKAEYARALTLAEQALSVDAENTYARLLRAQALQGLGKTGEARETFQEAIRSAPTSPVPLLSLGLLEISSNNWQAAEHAFQQCLSRFPGHALCTLGLANAYTSQSQYGKARALIEAELAKNPSRRELRLALANVLVLSGQYEPAIAILKDLEAAEPESADLTIRLGETYRLQGNLEAAIRQFRRARQLQPNNADIYVWLAVLLHMTGRPDEARQHYQQILRLQPENVVALNNLAFFMAENGEDLDLALTYVQRARIQAPNVPEIADTLGWIYIKKQLAASALPIYNELVAKYPTNPTYRYHRGMALLQQGDLSGARRELEAALRYKPDPAEKAQIEALLRRIG
jgi:tetratricopeptide (TPR) repeat protein